MLMRMQRPRRTEMNVLLPTRLADLPLCTVYLHPLLYLQY